MNFVASNAQDPPVGCAVMCTAPEYRSTFSKGKFEGIEQYARNKRIQVCSFCMLERHRSSPVMNCLDVPEEKLTSDALYFDRAEAPEHLMFSATRGYHSSINYIEADLHSMSRFSS
ncbi:hypothetical protein D5086_026566 [Populus alba]|uniref:Uncharacterized protein n=1 Tax=Populus alba TaxID=43335 RepID=A0ACC4B3R6_POPAL